MRRLLGVLRSTPVRVGFLLIALAAAVYAVVTQWDSIVDATSGMSPWLLLGSLVASVVYVLLTMMAWRVLLADMGTRLPLGPSFSVFFVSQLGKYLPGGVWNILAAAEMGADHKIPRRRSISVMLVTVVVSIVTGLALAVVTLAFAPDSVADTYGWTVIALPVFLIMLAPPVLNRLLTAALRLTGRPALERPVTWGGLALCVVWTLLAWVVAGLQVWLLAIGLGMHPDSTTLALCVGGYALAWTIGFLVVFVPAGAGVREAALGLVLAGSLSSGGVVAVVLLSRVVLTVADLAMGGAGLALARSGRRSRAEAAKATEQV